MDERADKVTGGCLCGAVRYQAEAYVTLAYYCHCRMCQRSSGTPAEVAVLVRPGTLAFTGEEPTFYRSSPFGRRGFCRRCGSRLVWMSPDRPAWTNLAVGSLDRPEDVVPREHACVESQLPWYRPGDDLPRRRSDQIPELVEAWRTAES